MNKQAGFLDQQTVLVLLGGVLIFIMAVVITNGVLIHWAVGVNASAPRCPTCFLVPHIL